MKDNKKGEDDFSYRKKIIKEKLEKIKRLTFYTQKYKDNIELIKDYTTEIEKVTDEIGFLLEGISDLEQWDGKKTERELNLEKKSILLAVPEGEREKKLMEIFEKVEMTVFWVTEGKKALDAYLFSRSGTFDAVLLDTQIPNKNGFLVAKAIRSSGKKNASWIPLIALIDRENEEEIRKAQEAGMDGWISTPFYEKDVLAMIFKLIRQGTSEMGSQSV